MGPPFWSTEVRYHIHVSLKGAHEVPRLPPRPVWTSNRHNGSSRRRVRSGEGIGRVGAEECRKFSAIRGRALRFGRGRKERLLPPLRAGAHALRRPACGRRCAASRSPRRWPARTPQPASPAVRRARRVPTPGGRRGRSEGVCRAAPAAAGTGKPEPGRVGYTDAEGQGGNQGLRASHHRRGSRHTVRDRGVHLQRPPDRSLRRADSAPCRDTRDALPLWRAWRSQPPRARSVTWVRRIKCHLGARPLRYPKVVGQPAMARKPARCRCARMRRTTRTLLASAAAVESDDVAMPAPQRSCLPVGEFRGLRPCRVSAISSALD